MIIFELYQDFFPKTWYNPYIILGINSFTNNPAQSCQDTRNNHGIHQDFWNNFRNEAGGATRELQNDDETDDENYEDYINKESDEDEDDDDDDLIDENRNNGYELEDSE